jgi:hypothetical protein
MPDRLLRVRLRAGLSRVDLSASQNIEPSEVGRQGLPLIVCPEFQRPPGRFRRQPFGGGDMAGVKHPGICAECMVLSSDHHAPNRNPSV